jgi:formamidopyrimidine-DNA glycosylase
MPELPEVETITNNLKEANINNLEIINFFRSEKKLRFVNECGFELIIGKKISKIYRKARYILIEIENNLILMIHLGMTGKLNISNHFLLQKHDHFAINLSNNSWLIYNDARRFGGVDLFYKNTINQHKIISNLGPEPLSKEFNAEYLEKKIANKKSANIKSVIMDNQIVVGVGNIYANESLFLAKILPTTNIRSISTTKIKTLVSAIKTIIAKAINEKGSSINTYVNLEGNLGNFQNCFQIYGRKNLACFDCKSQINKLVQNGRSSFFCPKCQK